MPLPSEREPLVDGGRITRVWLRALQDSLTAAEGAASGSDLTALQAALDSLTTTVNTNNVTLIAAIAALDADPANQQYVIASRIFS